MILPTYNRAHLVTRALQSVLNQTYDDFEVIVVDDASTDNTKEVVASFNDPRIRYFRHERNRGAAAARNTGITAARGEYIAFQDSDDEWLPEKLERQMRILENAPDIIGVVYTGFWRITGNVKAYIPSPRISCREGYIHSELLKGNFIGAPTAVVKRKCLVKVGMFDENLPRLQDWELFIRISKFFEFRYLDEPLVISYFTPNSISTDRNALVRALELILEKHFEEFKEKRRLMAGQWYWIGNLLCQNGQLSRGKQYLFRAVRLEPLNIKYSIAAFVALLGEGAYTEAAKLKRKIWRTRDG